MYTHTHTHTHTHLHIQKYVYTHTYTYTNTYIQGGNRGAEHQIQHTQRRDSLKFAGTHSQKSVQVSFNFVLGLFISPTAYTTCSQRVHSLQFAGTHSQEKKVLPIVVVIMYSKCTRALTSEMFEWSAARIRRHHLSPPSLPPPPPPPAATASSWRRGKWRESRCL